jgi:hypothetical protein
LSQLFIFQTHLLGDKRSAPIVIKGNREWIELYIPFHEFTQIFGGYVLWRKASKPSKIIPGEALGVWGKRNVSKLRRILRERGANFEVVEGEGPVQAIAIRGESPRGM